MRFRKKPIEIEARQFTTNNEPSGSPVMDALVDWCNEGHEDAHIAWHDKTSIFIATLEGTMTANVGDWIIRGVEGEFYPCKPNIFESTYSPVEESSELMQELTSLLNRFSCENVSDTPDHILAGYVANSLKAFNEAVRQRDEWYGFKPWPKPLLAAPQ